MTYLSYNWQLCAWPAELRVLHGRHKQNYASRCIGTSHWILTLGLLEWLPVRSIHLSRAWLFLMSLSWECYSGRTTLSRVACNIQQWTVSGTEISSISNLHTHVWRRNGATRVATTAKHSLGQFTRRKNTSQKPRLQDHCNDSVCHSSQPVGQNVSEFNLLNWSLLPPHQQTLPPYHHFLISFLIQLSFAEVKLNPRVQEIWIVANWWRNIVFSHLIPSTNPSRLLYKIKTGSLSQERSNIFSAGKRCATVPQNRRGFQKWAGKVIVIKMHLQNASGDRAVAGYEGSAHYRAEADDCGCCDNQTRGCHRPSRWRRCPRRRTETRHRRHRDLSSGSVGLAQLQSALGSWAKGWTHILSLRQHGHVDNHAQ